MAYDEPLAARIRVLLTGEPGIVEKKMFGGLAFMVNGNMAVTASGRGGLMARVDPSQSDALTADGQARLVEMRGRLMRGWLRVDSERLETADQLAGWVERSVAFARSLPAKQ